MRFRRKKKPHKIVKMVLEKDDEIMELELKVGKTIQMLKFAKKLAGYAGNGWQLKSITGDSDVAEMFKGVISGYKVGDAPPVKKMMQSAGVQAIPKQLRKLLKKDKEQLKK